MHIHVNLMCLRISTYICTYMFMYMYTSVCIHANMSIVSFRGGASEESLPKGILIKAKKQIKWPEANKTKWWASKTNNGDWKEHPWVTISASSCAKCNPSGKKALKSFWKSLLYWQKPSSSLFPCSTYNDLFIFLLWELLTFVHCLKQGFEILLKGKKKRYFFQEILFQFHGALTC